MRHRNIVAASLLLVTAVATAAYAAESFKNVTIVCTDGNALEGAAINAVTLAQPIHGGLFVTFDEVGLGNNAGTNYQVTAQAVATYGCINGGSNHPKANNKATVSGPVSATATFTSDANGKVSGSIAVPPLSPGSFDCPPGQRLELLSVSYTNVVLTDVSNGVSYSAAGPFTRSFF